MKKSFALLLSLGLVLIFSYLSVNIIQNKSYNDQINKMKYFEIQAQIHLKYIKENISNNPNINDNRFTLNIQETNTSYHVYLKTKDEIEAYISFYEEMQK